MSEKMRECKACKQQIASSAKVCPHCGAKNKKMNPILLGAIVVVAIAVIAGAGGNDEPVKVDGGVAQSKPSVTSTEASKNTFAVGETAELKCVQVALVGVTGSEGSSFNTPTDGNVFVLCEFEIANNSKQDVNVSSMMSFDAYCDDYSCSLSFGALLEKGNKEQLDGTVAAGKKFNGVVGYEVPADWQELEIHFTPDFLSGKDIVFVATHN